jgi:hypothetical protein
MTCSATSTTLTRMPRAFKFSAISKPIKPEPTTTAVCGLVSSTCRRMRSALTTLRK